MMTGVFSHNYGYFDVLPDETVENILIFIDADTLSDCRLVCKRWQKLIDTSVFQVKASRENEFVNNGQGYYSFSQISSNDVRKLDFPWYVFYVICKYDPFNRNLVKNHCGQDGWKHWKATGRISRENDPNYCTWVIQQIPQSERLMINFSNFDGHTSCFSSYLRCSFTKDQKIIFKDYGLNNNIMNSLQPEITVSAWYKCGTHNNDRYILRVYVCDDTSRDLLQIHISQNKFANMRNLWNKVSHTFQTDGNESYLTISHYMKAEPDDPFLDHAYDCVKISGSVVKVLLPSKFKSAK